MPKITVLPHSEICPQGTSFDANVGELLIDALLRHNVDIEHACEKACACTTCHVVIKDGFDSLDDASDDEEDMLDRAWGVSATSRLSCQTRIGNVTPSITLKKKNNNGENTNLERCAGNCRGAC